MAGMAFSRKEMMFLSCLCFAPLSQAAESPPEFNPVVSTGYLLKLGAALFLVLMVFIAFAWIFRRLNQLPAGHHGLRIVSGLNLGGKEKLIVVQVGEQQLLLGVSQNGISKLHLLQDRISETSQSRENDFSALLKTADGRNSS